MKLHLILALLLTLVGGVFAQNLLPAAGEGAAYGVWTTYLATQPKITATLQAGAGYKGSDALKVDLSKYGRLAVENLKLEAGKEYRFGAYIRAKNLKIKRGYLVVYNKYWRKNITTRSIPTNTGGKWYKVETHGVMPESADGKYTFALYVNGMEAGGELEISAPFIEEYKKVEAAPRKMAEPGANILPPMEADFNGPIGLWSRNVGMFDNAVKILPGKGYNGTTALELDCRETGGFRLGDIELVAGETYRFGAYVRTSGFDPNGSRIVIYNYKWGADASTGRFPADTNGQWQKVEATKVIPKSRNGRYNFIFYIPSHGKLEISNPYIIGVSPKAQKETPVMESYLQKIRRIYPVTPLLTKLDATNPKVTFSYSFPLEKPEDHQLRMRFADATGKWTQWKSFPIPADRHINTALGTAMPAGKGRLEVEIVPKSDASKAVLRNSYNVVFQAPLPKFEQKRLNNLVVELKNVALRNGTVKFINPRDGWVYIGFSENEKKATAVVDGTIKAITPRTGERSETMRYLRRGEHEVTVSGVSVSNGRLSIRTAPEIMLFPLEVFPQCDKSNIRYDLNFYRKYYLHSANVFFMLFAWNPKTAAEKALGVELADRGFRIMGSDGFNPTEWMNLDKMIEGISNNYPTATTAGRAVDETDANAEAQLLNNYAEASWEFAEYDKFIYLWMAATRCFLNYPLVHGPLMSGASHIGKGHGKLLMETYVETTPDLASLKEYYKLVKRHMVLAKRCSPDAPERMMMIMSGLLMNGAWNCNSYPQSDIKYALDYYYHLLATEPEARDLYGVGCYNLRYADEENARWISLLLRHYAVEGNTEMLSPKYGIKYNPGHVVNGDFKDGLNGWTATPAEGGVIRPHNRRNYGFSVQRRRGIGTNNGDTVLEIVRSAKGPNKLTQTFKNFEPGKLYSLSFVTADGDFVEKNIRKRSFSYLDAVLDGAEVMEDLSYEFRNPGAAVSGEKPDGTISRIEMVTRKIVFRAKKPEIKVTFSDWKSATEPGGPIGARRWLNFVNVNRYFAAE